MGNQTTTRLKYLHHLDDKCIRHEIRLLCQTDTIHVSVEQALPYTNECYHKASTAGGRICSLFSSLLNTAHWKTAELLRTEARASSVSRKSKFDAIRKGPL